jgi:hypothetical protein
MEYKLDLMSSAFDFIRADYNILQGIHRMSAHLPLTSTIRWVKGHQDQHKEWDKLSVEAKANIVANDECKQVYCRPVQESGMFPQWINGACASLLHNGRLITKCLEEYICIVATEPRHRQHLIKKSDEHDTRIKDKWMEEVFDNIAWKQHGLAFQSLSAG